MDTAIQLYLDKNELIREYCETLINKRAHIASFYLNGVVMPAEEVATTILRYAFEELLKWQPETALEWFNQEIAEQLKLKPYLKMISYPNEVDVKEDYWYAVYKTYPQTIKVDVRSLTLRTYDQILSGKRKKFPSKFFAGLDGQYRAATCLNYAINQKLDFKNLNDYYEFFSSAKGMKFIRSVGLQKICRDAFADPLEFTHLSLHPNQRNSFLYNFQKFNIQGGKS